MAQGTARVASKAGLHARPASELVTKANTFGSSITISLGESPGVDAKSILLVMTLGAEQGMQVTVTTEGDDADEALAAVIATIETDFDA